MLSLVLLAGAVTATAGCAPKRRGAKTDIVRECVKNSDQQGTFFGKWKKTPVPIALKAGNFDDQEVEEIAQGADVWNAFFQQSRGIQVIDYGSANTIRVSNAAKPNVSTLCSAGIVQANGNYSGQVVVYKQGRWPYSNRRAIALTTHCRVQAKPYQNMFMAVIELNYEDYFVEGRKRPDLKSILIHEFGHLIGLDHSCAVKAASGFPDCNSDNLLDEYFEAVMFPVILFDENGSGEQRHSLNDNDMGRANCLYDSEK